MRVKLILLAAKQRTLLPPNYNHSVAALIYEIVGRASTDFATRLHNEGYSVDGRRFKLFTFSRIGAHHIRIQDGQLLIEDSTVTLQISSPIREFAEHFISGLFRSETFNIAGARFTLVQAETMPAPAFVSQMSFRALSPITESVRDERGCGRFLSPEDDWSPFIERNLVRKYLALNGRPPTDQRLRWTWDQEYLAKVSRRGLKASVLTHIRGIKVRGWLAPFAVKGSPELIRLGYEAGFGARNSMGFGMADVTP